MTGTLLPFKGLQSPDVFSCNIDLSENGGCCHCLCAVMWDQSTFDLPALLKDKYFCCGQGEYGIAQRKM